MSVSGAAGLLLVGIVALATGCAAEPAAEEEAEVGAQAASGKPASAASLQSFVGAWSREAPARAGSAGSGQAPSREIIEVTAAENAPAPSEDSSPWNTVVQMKTPDGIAFRDRAPFARIGEDWDCSMVDMERHVSVNICHLSTLKGQVLTHTVTLREYRLGIPTFSASKAVQELSITTDGSLRYRYSIDGEISEDLSFSRER